MNISKSPTLRSQQKYQEGNPGVYRTRCPDYGKSVLIYARRRNTALARMISLTLKKPYSRAPDLLGRIPEDLARQILPTQLMHLNLQMEQLFADRGIAHISPKNMGAIRRFLFVRGADKRLYRKMRDAFREDFELMVSFDDPEELALFYNQMEASE